jgi:hypothetical protein
MWCRGGTRGCHTVAATWLPRGSSDGLTTQWGRGGDAENLHVELGGVGAPQELGADVEVRAADDLPREKWVLGVLTVKVLGVLTVDILEIGTLGPPEG